MVKTAFLFPGQGSQYVGMGKDLYDRYDSAKNVFEQAAAILGPELLEVIFQGPEEKLKQTEYTQPAVLATSLAVAAAVVEEMGLRPEGAAGLSLGEYSALVVAGSMAFEDALTLVRRRGKLMQEAVPPGQGMMAAVMGLPREEIERICCQVQTLGIAEPANYNCPGQVVISGEPEAVRKAGDLAREAGAKKVVVLKVSAPFHCALLKPVEEEMARELADIDIRPPSIPVVFNCSAGFLSDPPGIKQALIRQVSQAVLWEDSIRRLIEEGYDTFLELGPGKVLTGFMKRIDPTRFYASIGDRSSLIKVQAELKEVSKC
ncbi:MAG TPA: ACP S-malonyltransferase, partial [Firmicutes bacterium]|nr:ACP S-malonyltransferase [Bacillota bacterium]